MPLAYAYDPTGSLPDNRITDETHTLVAPTTAQEALVVIPQQGPFHASSLIVTPMISGSPGAALVEGVDYFLCFQVTSALAVGLVVYAGIVFIDRNRVGNIRLTYQTIGGDYVNSQNRVLLQAIRQYLDVRFIYYDQLVNVPTAFTPAPHSHPSTEAPMPSLITALTALKDAVVAKYTP